MKDQELTIKDVCGLVGDTEKDISSGQLMELLCQISLALLMVFIMANVLFNVKSKTELEQAKTIAKIWKSKYQDLEGTTVGQQYQLRYKALIDLQKQKLLNALNRLEALYRSRCGLSAFTTTKEGGELEFVTKNVLTNTKVSDLRFAAGCRLAKKKLLYKDSLKKEWFSKILSIEGMRTGKALEDPTDHKSLEEYTSQVISKENEHWLNKQIDIRTERLRVDCIGLQRAVLADLQSYFVENPQALKETDIHRLIEKYLSANEKDKNMLLRQIGTELIEYGKKVLKRQDVPVLDGV